MSELSPRKPLGYNATPSKDYVVRRGNTVVWRGEARGCVHALDLARAAHPELRGVDLNVTSPAESV